MADTIFALASAPGRAAVAIVRLSGPGTAAALRALTGARPRTRRPSLKALKRPADAAPLDQALVLWFPKPHSYTGEDVAELHLHGGAAVIDAVTDALLGLGLRLALPGEFTRRAFENGKLDLSQAEAIGDLVEAETDAQRRQALAQLDGDLARRHAAWREVLIEALAMLEAAVDFPDEDLPAEVARGAVAAPRR
jgi:tRNA modification GTPase